MLRKDDPSGTSKFTAGDSVVDMTPTQFIINQTPGPRSAGKSPESASRALNEKGWPCLTCLIIISSRVNTYHTATGRPNQIPGARVTEDPSVRHEFRFTPQAGICRWCQGKPQERTFLRTQQEGGVVWGPDRVWTWVGQVSDISSLMSFTWKSFNLLGATLSSVNWMDDRNRNFFA